MLNKNKTNIFIYITPSHFQEHWTSKFRSEPNYDISFTSGSGNHRLHSMQKTLLLPNKLQNSRHVLGPIRTVVYYCYLYVWHVIIHNSPRVGGESAPTGTTSGQSQGLSALIPSSCFYHVHYHRSAIISDCPILKA